MTKAKPIRPYLQTNGHMKWRESLYVAQKVARGALSRGQIEKCREAFPDDEEPVIILKFLDKWGIS